MFLKKTVELTAREKALAAAYEELDALNADSDEYAKIMDQIVKLEELAPKKETFLKADTVALIASNLLGIGLILGFEKANVVTSKALGFVTKSKI